jgi:hypothetical protein
MVMTSQKPFLGVTIYLHRSYHLKVKLIVLTKVFFEILPCTIRQFGLDFDNILNGVMQVCNFFIMVNAPSPSSYRPMFNKEGLK